MIRKYLAALLALCLLGTACLAESGYFYYGSMMVDFCESWVSLREAPDTGAERLAKVPLYAVVTDADWMPSFGDFIRCSYDGQYGFILSRYLTPFEGDSEPAEGLMMETTVNGLHIYAKSGYAEGAEHATVTCEDSDGNLRWQYDTATEYATELSQLLVFMGGAAQDPMVMVYNADEGLTALDVFSGEVRWTLSDVDMGAGNSWETDGEGNTYIGGFYGPDPVAVDVYGNVKWRADSEGCYWLYHMEIVDGELVCWYDAMDDDPDLQGSVTFDLNGRLLSKTYGE